MRPGPYKVINCILATLLLFQPLNIPLLGNNHYSFAQTTTATVPSIYIDPSSIDTVQDGTQAHPYHSWKEIPNNNPTRIATYYFKRGTRLVWPITIYNPNTTASNFITFDAYGKGSNRLNFTTGTWANEGNGVYSRTVGSTDRNLRAFYVNDDEQQEDYFYAYFVRKGYANIIPKNGPRAGKWIYNAANDKIYWKSSIGDPNTTTAQWGTETDKPKIIGRIPISQSAWKGPINGVYSFVVNYPDIQNFYTGDPENSIEIIYSNSGATPPDGYWGKVGNTIYFNPTGTSASAPTQSQYNSIYYKDPASMYGSTAMGWYGIMIVAGDYSQFKNIYVKNSGRHGIWGGQGNDNVTLRNCNTSHNGNSLNEAGRWNSFSPGFGDGISLGGNNIVISDCESGFNQDSGFSDENLSNQPKKATLTDNWFHNVGAHTISIHGSEAVPGIVIGTNLIVENGGDVSLKMNGGYQALDYGAANVAYNSATADFIRCVFDSSGGTNFMVIGGIGTNTVKYCLITNSNLNNNADYSYHGNESMFMNNVGSSTYLKLILHNNIFYEPKAKNMWQKWASDYFPSVEAKNNIFIAGEGNYNIEATANIANNPNAIFDHNNIGKGTFLNSVAGAKITDINTWNAKSYVGTDMATNPLFTNEASNLFSLQSTSPMINAGVDVGLTTDILGNPISGNPDIGAFEYQATSASDTTTPPITISAPTVTTTQSTNVTSNSSTLSGTVNPNGASTTAWFEYGTTSGSYNGKTANQALSGSNNTSIGANITGLLSATTYYYRIVAQNSAGTNYGAQMSFTTAAFTSTDTTLPTITITSPTTNTAYNTSNNSLSLSGSASDNVGVSSVTWANTKGGNGTAAGTTSWSIANISLISGDNVVTVTAKDASGNAATDTLTVSYTPPVPTTNSLAHYRFDDGTATDSSGNNKNGTVNGATSTTGKINSALYFNGGASNVSVPLLNSDEISVSLWFNRTKDDTTNHDYLVDAIDWTRQEGFNLYFNKFTPWKLTFTLYTKNSSGIKTVNAAEYLVSNINSVWHHAIATYNKTTGEQKLYVDDVLVATQKHPAGNIVVPVSARSNYFIGYAQADYAFNGSIDEARFYNYALSASEITNLFNATTTPSVTDTTAPTVSINSPTTAPTYSTTSSTLNLGGTASDASGITSVTCVNNGISCGTLTGTSSWSLSNLALATGTNTITVTAKDTAGNNATDTITVSYSASSTTGKTYYIDPAGNDANNGLSSSTPWKTIAKVNSYNFLPGDSILFKRGGVWKEGVTLSFNKSGTQTNPITISAYGTGNKPIISSIRPIPGANIATNWTLHATNVWKMTQITPSINPNQRLWLNGNEVLDAVNVAKVGTSNNTNNINDQRTFEGWIYEPASSTLYVYSPSNPATQYNSIEGNLGPIVFGLQPGVKYITIDGLDFRGGGSFTTLNFDTVSYITLRNSDIGYGHVGLFITSSNPDPTLTSNNILIENNRFDSGYKFLYSVWRGASEDGIHLRDAVNNTIIRNNTFNDWGHTAVGITAVDYPNKDGNHHNKIHNNTFDGSNVSYGRALGMDGLEGKTHDNEIYNNLIRNHTQKSQTNGNNNWIHHNIFDGQTNSPVNLAQNWGVGQAINLAVYRANVVCHDNKIDNNLFLNTDEAGVLLKANGFTEKVRNNYIRNNIFYNTGRNAISYQGRKGVAIAMEKTVEEHSNTFENNCIFNPGQPTSNAINYYGTFMSVADFNLRNGNNGNTISSNLQIDPLFVDYLNKNYYLQLTSPCIDKGIGVSLTSDFVGNPIGAGPDIGVYEYSITATNPPTATTNTASTITSSSAIVSATVNPNGSSTTAYFQYGTTSGSYTGKTADQALTGTTALSVSVNLAGLSANTTYYYRVVATNSVGTTNGLEMSFTTANVTDTIAPTVSVSSPVNGSTVSGIINVSANASDNVAVAGVQFRRDGINLGTEDTTSPYSVSWNTTGVTNGSHTLTAVARDATGNTATSASVTVTVNNTIPDTTRPTGSIQINNNATYTGTISVTLALSASDTTGVAGYYLSTSSTAPSATSAGWIAIPSTLSYSASISYSLASGDGTKTVYCWYKDASSNVSTTASDSIILDTTAPTVAITIPTTASSYVTTESLLGLSGSVSDSTSGVLSVQWTNSRGGSGTTIGTTDWAIDGISLLGEENVITITATDSAGNNSTDTLTVTYSIPQAPTVTTGEYSTLTSDSATISGTVNPDGAETNVWFEVGTMSGWYTFSVPAQTLAATAATTTVSVGLTDLAEGTTYYYRLAASNSAGTSYGNEMNFTTKDAIAPEGSISINFDERPTNSQDITLILHATDNVGVRDYYISMSSVLPLATASGWIPIESSPDYYAQISYSLPAGDESKTVYCWYKDGAGNVSSAASDTIILDTTGPVVRITLPTSNTSYSTRSEVIGLQGTASDALSQISSIGWLNSSGGEGLIEVSEDWQIPGVYLVPGENIITVTATDTAGNTNNDSITITYTPPNAPTVTTQEYSAVTGNSATISGTVNPDGAETNVWFEVGTMSGWYTFSVPAQTLAATAATTTVSVGLTDLAEGTTYYYRLAASNSAGTSYGNEMSFTTDTLTNTDSTT